MLPAAAIPSEVHPVDELPRTSSGKIDRNEIARVVLAADS